MSELLETQMPNGRRSFGTRHFAIEMGDAEEVAVHHLFHDEGTNLLHRSGNTMRLLRGVSIPCEECF